MNSAPQFPQSYRVEHRPYVRVQMRKQHAFMSRFDIGGIGSGDAVFAMNAFETFYPTFVDREHNALHSFTLPIQ